MTLPIHINRINENLVRRSQKRFERIVKPMLDEGKTIKEIAAAKNMTYAEVYNLVKRARLRGEI